MQMQGTYYPKPWAVKVAMMYNKNTPERGRAIRDMIINNRVPRTSTRLLSDLIKLETEKKFFVHDAWKPVGNNRQHGLILALVPVKCVWKCPQITPSFYAPPKQVCLRDWFQLEKRVRLYFSPRQFPTPMKLQYADIENQISCNSGGKPGVSKRFSCKTKQCKFYFVVKWDKYGRIWVLYPSQ